MKKILTLMIVLAMVFAMAACGGTQPATPSGDAGETTQATVGQKTPDFVFEYKGTEITLHADARPILEKLGEPVKYTESASCAFDGLDKSYYYGSFYLETYPQCGGEWDYGWWFADDSVTTEEGIYIGSTQADVEKAYGAENYNGTNAYVVARGDGTLTVILENGAVSSIQYAINLG